MLIVEVEFETAPKDRDTALAELRAEKPRVMALAGCKKYEIRVDPDHLGKVTLLEAWNGNEAFIAYKNSSAFKTIGGKLFPLMVTKPSTQYYGVVEDPTGE